jgi:molecular chaperone GrpE (heat shock protein)
MECGCFPIINARIEPSNIDLIDSLITHIQNIITILEKREKNAKTQKMLKEILLMTKAQFLNILNEEIYPFDSMK